MTLLLNCELVSRVNLCLVTVSVVPDIVIKDCSKMTNLPNKFRECGPDFKLPGCSALLLHNHMKPDQLLVHYTVPKRRSLILTPQQYT